LVKDVASSNGTFVNGHRLSNEGVPSPPFELHYGDVLEFGVDILNDDNATGTDGITAVACFLPSS
jgi:pSer/pThr/pTyr-binding forkhead associated (FHA) protein